MKTWVASFVGGTCFCVSSVAAAPCVGDAFDQPFPDATETAVHHLDIPSSRFPGLWQEGRVGAWDYRLFANGDGDLRANYTNADGWQISFTCQDTGESCTQSVVGAPPDEALYIATNLQACLLGQDVLVPELPEPEPEPEPEAAPAPVAVDVPQVEPCGSELLRTDTDEVVLQKLLALAGGDPGPADGILGPQSRRATIAVIGEDAAALELVEAIAALDQLICD